MIFEDQVISYADFDTTVNRIAHGFLRLGISAGDRMCVSVRCRDAFPKTPTQRVEKYKLCEEYARACRADTVLGWRAFGTADVGSGKGYLISCYAPV
jgi:hypothetical protein